MAVPSAVYFTGFLLATTGGLLPVVYSQQQVTPVIGGKCDINAPDVPIGGKQTQFFLKCEHSLQSENGKGVWVVKSRSVSATTLPVQQTNPSSVPPTVAAAAAAAAIPVNTNSNGQEHVQQFQKPDSSVCVQDKSAREGDPCSVSPLCLQQDQQQSSHYLQCDQNSNRWIKKSCLDGQTFSFEHQSCIVPSANPLKQSRLGTRHHGSSGPGSLAGIVCTFMQCSPNNPCQRGTCNNGYCCISPTGHGLLNQPFAAPIMQHHQPLIINSQPSFPISSHLQPAYNPAAINICANGGSPAGSCLNMRCARGYVCSPGNVCCPSSSSASTVTAIPAAATAATADPFKNPFVCNDGTQAVGACVLGQCGTGFSCSNGLCCNVTSNTPRCLDSSQSAGACLNGQCGAGYVCTTGNLCCPPVGAPAGACPNGGTSIGACINGLCPTGYTCINGQCCPDTTSVTFRCSNTNYVLGPCVGNQCPDAGFQCDTTINSCCPRTDPVGPCIEPGNQCPNNYKCFTEGATPLCYRTCDGRGTRSGEPVNGECPGGPTTLIFGDCCTLTTRFYNAKPTSFLSGRHVDHLYSTSLSTGGGGGVGICPDGTGAVSACINGMCGYGYQCYNNLCCPAQSTNLMVPFSPATLRPIGGPCEFTQQCASSGEGLSVCELGTCRCLPGAYVNGFVCVRRFNIFLNDAERPSLSNVTLADDHPSAIEAEKTQ